MQAEGKGEQQMLVPTVLWAQRKNMVLLRVQIQPLEVSVKRSYGVYICIWRRAIQIINVSFFVQKPDFAIRESYMTFKGNMLFSVARYLYQP